MQIASTRGSGSGSRPTGCRLRCAPNSGRWWPAPSCSSSGSSTGRAPRWPTSSSPTSTIGGATGFLSIRHQNNFEPSLRNRRLMTLAHVFLIHRYKAGTLHYVTPTEDNLRQPAKMKDRGLFSEVHTEGGQIIVATVNAPTATYTDTGLLPGRTYYYNVVAVGGSDQCFTQASRCVSETPTP